MFKLLLKVQIPSSRIHLSSMNPSCLDLDLRAIVQTAWHVAVLHQVSQMATVWGGAVKVGGSPLEIEVLGAVG